MAMLIVVKTIIKVMLMIIRIHTNSIFITYSEVILCEFKA